MPHSNAFVGLKLSRRTWAASGLLLSLSMILGGCASTSVEPSSLAAAPGPSVASKPSAAEPSESKETLPAVELNSRLLFQLVLSEIAAQRGNPGAAHLSYMQMARDTQDPRLARRAFEMALASGQAYAALEAAQLWVSLAPNSPEAQRASLTLLAMAGRLDALEPLLANRVETATDKEAVVGEVLQITARTTDRPATLELLKRVFAPLTDAKPPVAEAWLALASVAHSAKLTEEALALTAQAQNAQPDSERVVLVHTELLNGTDPKAALSGLESFVRKHPDARQARLALARLYAQGKDLVKAKAQFAELAKPQKDGKRDADALFGLGVMQMRLNELDQAALQFNAFIEIAIALDRDPSNGYTNLGIIAEEQGKPLDALKWYDQVSDDPQFNYARMRAAAALGKLGRLDEARAKLASIKPADKDEQVRLVLSEAQLLRDAGKTADAETVLSNALKAMPDEPDLLYDYAMAIEKSGRIEDMEKSLRRVMELNPKNAHAYNALGYSLADRGQRLDEARALIEKAIALAPDDAFIMDSLGWVQYRQGQLADAIKTLQKAYGIRQDAEIAVHLGEVLWVSGQRDEAQKLWAQAKKLAPTNETLAATLARYNIALP
jgi:tetratricopeptide (TPR) repeat protein